MGSPYLRPLEELKYFIWDPLMRMVIRAVHIQDIKSLMVEDGKLKYWSV